MTHTNGLAAGQPWAPSFSIHPKMYVFFDKGTGAPRFEMQASHDGSLPVDQAVSLLAMHCVARQKLPEDFGLMVSTGQNLRGSIVGRAMKLIRAWSEAKPRAFVSHRQQEVLVGIAENLTNKEIAARLNISERTVEFHVSALLAKYGVKGRVDLMLEAANILPRGAVHRREARNGKESAPRR